VESHNDRELLNVPSGSVQRLICFGSVGVSAGLRSWALATKVDQVFISRRGSYLGHALPASSGPRLARLRAQLAFADDETRRLPLARAVVNAKVTKQVTLLRRFARRENAERVLTRAAQMEHLTSMLPDCSTRDELMGIEGASAREYFAALAELMPEDMQFAGRSTQPPADTVNSSLSYGYAILLGEAVSALCAAGLDPGIGLLHTEQERRPSLALDLMEEFRPLIVDQVVIAAARKAELRPEHSRREETIHGVLLTKAGKEVLVSHYERRMLQHTRGALPGMSGSLRRHLYRQAERIASCISDPAQTWTGLSWR
jgi:CRISPR-associated protein Cas1